MDSDAPPAVTPRRLPRQRVVVLGALLGWALPGLGQLWAGQPRKAILFGATILSLFAVGWWLTGFTVVDPERYRLDFLAQALLGGPTAFALEQSRDITLTAMPRFFDVGRLYVQVAGLLNLVAMADAVGDLIRHNRRALAMRQARGEEPASHPSAPEALGPTSDGPASHDKPASHDMPAAHATPAAPGGEEGDEGDEGEDRPGPQPAEGGA